jgi:hypothetical protein
MLLGGMSVIGAYVWASEASFKATSPAVLSQVSTISCFVSLVSPHMLMLWFSLSTGGSMPVFQVIRAISQACYGSACGERLLIHISYSPRRCCLIFLHVNFGSLLLKIKKCLFVHYSSS